MMLPPLFFCFWGFSSFRAFVVPSIFAIAGITALAGQMINDYKLSIFIWVTINLLGMAIIAYLFTPLFLVATILGMSLAYILYALKNKNQEVLD